MSVKPESDGDSQNSIPLSLRAETCRALAPYLFQPMLAETDGILEVFMCGWEVGSKRGFRGWRRRTQVRVRAGADV